MPAMSNEPATRSRKPVADFMPFVAVALTVLLAVFGQAAWLDGKIERLDTKLTGEFKRMEYRLDAKIEALQEGQAAIRERLAGLESRVAALASRVAALESRVAGLDSRVVGLDSRVAALESRVAQLESRIDARSTQPSEPV